MAFTNVFQSANPFMQIASAAHNDSHSPNNLCYRRTYAWRESVPDVLYEVSTHTHIRNSHTYMLDMQIHSEKWLNVDCWIIIMRSNRTIRRFIHNLQSILYDNTDHGPPVSNWMYMIMYYYIRTPRAMCDKRRRP